MCLADGQVAAPQLDHPDALTAAMAGAGYLAEPDVARTVWFALQIGRPLLVEGPPGSGKTELAKALASVTGARLVRLQCYEGLDESRILYEWDYRKQLLRIQAALKASDDVEWNSLSTDLFSEHFLLARPLLETMRGEGSVLLLVDGVDLMTAEAEALLLEALSDFAVTIPELGTVQARQTPLVVLTSNGSRELSAPLRRRCVVACTSHPTPSVELEVVARWLPGIAERIVGKIEPTLAELDSIDGSDASRAGEWAATLRYLASGPSPERAEGLPPEPGSAKRSGSGPAAEKAALLTAFHELVAELRAAGMPVSAAENLDALRALDAVPLGSREILRGVLGATLVKRRSHLATFDTLFDVFFGVGVAEGDEPGTETTPDFPAPAGHGATWTDAELATALFGGLLVGDRALMRAVAREAVRRYADIRPGRTMRGLYYAFQTLRRLNLDGIEDRLVEAYVEEAERPLSSLQLRLAEDEFTTRVDTFRKEVEAEIRRRLVANQGAAALGAAGRKPLPEDLDFLDADARALEDFRRLLRPLTAQLAVRMRSKQSKQLRGSVDFRRTVRRSMSTGGVPLDLCWRRSNPTKGEVIVIADMSGSVAPFARFTVMLIHALSGQFRRIRTFAFIDEIDEVTALFSAATDLPELVDLINNQARLTWFDGHSDYGRAFEEFLSRWGPELAATTTVLVLGDGRNNYRASRAAAVRDLAKRCRRLIWLNPEPLSNWNSGDSVIGEYAAFCDGVYECRNIRQLAAFVERVL